MLTKGQMAVAIVTAKPEKQLSWQAIADHIGEESTGSMDLSDISTPLVFSTQDKNALSYEPI